MLRTYAKHGGYWVGRGLRASRDTGVQHCAHCELYYTFHARGNVIEADRAHNGVWLGATKDQWLSLAVNQFRWARAYNYYSQE